MYLLLVITSTTIALSVGNPFHKLPFVFLLDVGNEELEKTNTEQIRLSAPGGSLAVRYPAIGNGDIIGHVRVSGIDYGTNLQANIYDGGPGYSYVVLVFSGNDGVPYDVIVTIQTLSDFENIDQSEKMSNEIETDDNDPNDSAEDTSDSTEETSDKNAELMQSSSNYYSYAQSELSQSYEGDTDNNLDIHKPRSQSAEDIYGSNSGSVKDCVESENNDSDVEGDDTDDGDADDDNEDHDNENTSENEEDNQNVEELGNIQTASEESQDQQGYVNSKDYDSFGDDNEDNDDKSYSLSNQDGQNIEEAVRVDSNLNDKYKALMPHLYDSKVEVYPQNSYDVREENNEVYEPVSDEDRAEIDQMFNDEEIHNDAATYKDSNNNYFDADDSSAVAY